MNGYYVVIILFALIFGGSHYLKRKKSFKVTGPLAMFRTKHGIRIIDAIAHACPRFWRGFYTFGVAIGFIAMFYIFYALFKNTLKIFTTPDAAVGAIPVIPGVTIPFWVGIIGLITVLVFHELSHGIIARAENVRLKSVGLASLGFLPIGAFVEPDDKQLRRRKLLPQLRMFVAGSFMNFIIALVAFLLLSYALLPGLAVYVPGAHILSTDAGGPAESAGLTGAATLNTLAGQQVTSIDDFSKITKNLEPGQRILLDTDRGVFPVELGEKGGKAWIGIQAAVCSKNLVNPLCYSTRSWMPSNVFWFTVGAFNWIVLLNFGIGLFNLLPLKPFDGGLMTEAITKKISPLVSKITVRGLGVICILMIIINLAGPYIL
ncbi:MAG: site-2 protease family protein [archaeon]